MSSNPSSPLRHIPYMGVIKVVADAMELGFYNGNPDWCNLGQGQPEIGPMEGAPERISTIEMQPIDHASCIPVNGHGGGGMGNGIENRVQAHVIRTLSP